MKLIPAAELLERLAQLTQEDTSEVASIFDDPVSQEDRRTSCLSEIRKFQRNALEAAEAFLRDALADALSASSNEQGNIAYERDLADLMRSYVHARINQAIWDAAMAVRSGDMAAFERHYAHIERLFDYLLKAINLVSHYN